MSLQHYTNKQLRTHATAIAQIVSKAINLKTPVKCTRITRKRGHGYLDGSFSVPGWAARHEVYFNYYAAHETVHALPRIGRFHGPAFMQEERKALRAIGLAPIYQKGGAGPYVDALTDLEGRVVCVFPRLPNGQPAAYPTDPPIVYV